MPIRSLVTAVVLLVFLAGCGSKKRTTYKKPERTVVEHTRAESTPPGEKAIYPMPEDDGKFVTIRITDIQDYIDTFSEIAQFEMKAYGIPASITLAQGILESGYGQGELTRKTNNHFGIKCHTGWNGAYESHDDDEKGECFRKYNHPMYSFRDHSIFLSTRARYASLFDLRRDDYKGWAHGLRAAGYATDRRYPQKLIDFIERYQLYKYDREVLQEGYSVKREPKAVFYTQHTVQKGDTLYSLSRKYFISVPDLMELNNLKDHNLAIGQVLKIRTENSRQ